MVQKESTISIRNTTRRRLKGIGFKGQTYDQLINVLLDLKHNKMDSLDHRVVSLKPSEPSSA